MAGVCTSPLIGRVVDQLAPWGVAVIATLCSLACYAVETAAGGLSIGAVVVTCFGIDVFRQTQQVSLTHAAFGLDADARSRLKRSSSSPCVMRCAHDPMPPVR